LESRFLQAERKLAELDNENPAAQWANKVRTVQPTLPLLPPHVVDDVLENLQEALLLNKKLDVNYQSSTDNCPAQKILNPLGLVNRGAVTYLVATKNDCDDVRLYALHRFHKAIILTNEVKRPIDFSLDDFINSGALQFGNGNAIILKAYIVEWLAQHLTETPLSEDQKLTIYGNKTILTATVPDSWQLEWWILSLGAAIEIISPIALRTNISSRLELAAALYSPHAGKTPAEV
jgi:predicted DNA-binding transcriptional regulator YafY